MVALSVVGAVGAGVPLLVWSMGIVRNVARNAYQYGWHRYESLRNWWQRDLEPLDLLQEVETNADLYYGSTEGRVTQLVEKRNSNTSTEERRDDCDSKEKAVHRFYDVASESSSHLQPKRAKGPPF